MDHPQLSPASLCDSELDDTSSTANSPMSISSAEACSSPYDSSRLSGDEDLSLAESPISSPPSSPSPSESICNNNNNNINNNRSSSSSHSNQYIWSDINPYYSGAKSIRWFRDDRGLWSERSSSNSRRSSPYQRNTQSKTHVTSNKHKEISEVLIEAVCRQDQTLLHNLLAVGKGSAHVNILGHEGDSPLHRSCRIGDLETVKLLVS